MSEQQPDQDMSKAVQSPDERLVAAAHAGDLPAVQQAVTDGANIDAKVVTDRFRGEEFQSTALHLAVLYAHEAAAVYLLEKGADANAVDSAGRAPLHLATIARQTNFVRMLLNAGADVNLKDAKGYSPLHSISSVGNSTEIIDLLLERGADVNAADNGGVTPIFDAVYNAQPVLVKKLLEHGAMFNAFDNNGEQPIHFANRDKLKERGGMERTVECLALLLEAGASADAPDRHGKTLVEQCENDPRIAELVAVFKAKAGVDATLAKFRREGPQGDSDD
ncbi:ankyrin repeat domain-containing protein [Noviherbaspirillum pedocola]|uniref:Ankyrin repeat domain-containing protein n=1 Tax=Noviherbaspirillum pedocola TaxID=2801341 RepID=A0A934W6T2_9BURK|nr:ankyrin repeat domain-containing protein [Noviherbaspirillum pedocola]MBK4735520.1 ankyrin repeat domain-containing protein [Noviherbaspirillum pedocola]